MFNEEGKLIVIHEYPTPSLQPFLNPICKDTYHALPKIYGQQKRKRYEVGPQASDISHSTRCIRDCCSFKYEETHRPVTQVKEHKRLRINSMKIDNQSKRRINS